MAILPRYNIARVREIFLDDFLLKNIGFAIWDQVDKLFFNSLWFRLLWSTVIKHSIDIDPPPSPIYLTSFLNVDLLFRQIFKDKLCDSSFCAKMAVQVNDADVDTSHVDFMIRKVKLMAREKIAPIFTCFVF